jgi:hypothetical protein
MHKNNHDHIQTHMQTTLVIVELLYATQEKEKQMLEHQ